jgi:hypothetical protein
MLVAPNQTARFFGLSHQFVNHCLELWGWDFRPLSPTDYGRVLELFPPELRAHSFLSNPGAQIRILLPVEERIQQADTVPDQDFNAEALPVALTAEECEDQIVNNTADSLDISAESTELDRALGTALGQLDSALRDRHLFPRNKAADPPPDPAREQLIQVKETLALVRGELKEKKTALGDLQRELARTWKFVYERERWIADRDRTIADRDREIADLKRQLAALRNPEAAQANPEPAQPEPEPPLPLQVRLVNELCTLVTTPPNERHYSDDLKKVCWVIYSLSPKSYRVTHKVLPVPSATTLLSFMRDRKIAATAALTGGDELDEYLQEYRKNVQMPDESVPCVLAFDATPVVPTGVRFDKTGKESCFAFLLLPLDHRYPDTLLKSVLWKNGAISAPILKVKDDLCARLAANQFKCHFIATDGDSGMNPAHTAAFAKYQDFQGGLAEIVAQLIASDPDGLSEWPIPDLLHMEKNARAKLATSNLALHSASGTTLTARSVADDLNSDRMRKVLTARSRLDFLKDGFALETFTLENLIELWQSGHPIAAYFMLPWVALNLAVRNPTFTVETRLSLIEVAFTVFFDVFHNYPETGHDAGILQQGKPDELKTFWSILVCQRGCNLCVGLYWAIERWGHTQFGFCLALARIGSHSCECHFGITRSALNGETRWCRFVAAQVTASLIHRILWELDISPYIRRFKSEAGTTLDPNAPGVVEMSFEMTIELMALTLTCLSTNQEQEVVAAEDTIMTPFLTLRDRLEEIAYTEKIRLGSPMAGQSIATRWKVFAMEPIDGAREQHVYYHEDAHE